ncbi:MAG: hypothetical protein HYR56_22175 [Acidobacteria bacterium]|nr:hypothetical protein [Acidobacteriota bacterium]MBI3423204.1 hypothetical protein [Acidobacteriota bacterium]
MDYAIRALLTELIDYAGLFPPAALNMNTAVRNYAAYRQSNHRWLLAHFVVPMARLGEFETAAAELLPTESPWQLSALLGSDWQNDLAQIAAFNERHAGRAVIDTVEGKAETSAQLESLRQTLPAGLTAYFEIPLKDDPAELITTLAQTGGLAKARTGGVTAEAVPSALELARFIAACAKAEVPFKATAGLHHPLRGAYRLTYAPDSPTATMHGFLNVFLAAAFAQSGMDVAQLIEVLEERSPTAFTFESGRVVWRDEELVRAHLINARHLAALAFGSCSFTEPVEDLQKLGLL